MNSKFNHLILIFCCVGLGIIAIYVTPKEEEENYISYLSVNEIWEDNYGKSVQILMVTPKRVFVKYLPTYRDDSLRVTRTSSLIEEFYRDYTFNPFYKPIPFKIKKGQVWEINYPFKSYSRIEILSDSLWSYKVLAGHTYEITPGCLRKYGEFQYIKLGSTYNFIY